MVIRVMSNIESLLFLAFYHGFSEKAIDISVPVTDNNKSTAKGDIDP